MMKRAFLSETEEKEARRVIEEKTGYRIKSRPILSQIFRRSSSTAETGYANNEVFELIGDRVLDFYVTKIVAKKCGGFGFTGDYTFRIGENRFTLIKQELVKNEALAKIMDEWNLSQYLILGQSDIKNGAEKETKIKADLLEAIFGAIATESDWDAAILEEAVSKGLNAESRIDEMIEADTKVRCFSLDNAITALKEVAESGRCTMPEYDFEGPDKLGYDSDGNPKWYCSCSVMNDRMRLVKNVQASSKKEAKKAAAYLILCEQLNMQNRYGPNDLRELWIYKDGKLLRRPSF